MFTHNISPEFFSVGPLTIYWYGLLFVIGVVLAYFVLRSIYKEQKYKLEDLDSVGIYLFIGLVVGARLGHIVFYDFDYFWKNPLEILQVWNGGLASHGAAIGVFVAYLVWIAVHKVKFFKYADALVVAFPLVATFVRLGNFVNSEIVGIPTDSAVGVTFVQLGENFARHPVQLYSSLMNLSIFVVLIVLYKKYYKKSTDGFFLFLYMGLYFIGRFVVEFWKDLHALPESFPLSMGQVLSIAPVLIAAVYFIFYFPKLNKGKN
ncbi:MAG: prolipoprotein diacylglyceryl transferase [Nitrospirae bacterium]|nr:prolipoprotein diacylglyceryl transferase [Nitrospirota bacterium]